MPVVLLSAAHAMAQPVLTHANTSPTVGMNTVYYSTNITSPGAAGANVTWNFATIPNNGNSTASYIACSAAPDCGVMTGANVVMSGVGNYIYYNAGTSALSVRGIKVNNVLFDYNNPEDYLRYPFAFNDSYADSVNATFTSGSPMVRKGQTTVTADGWGTLILPTGTFTNVLRVHRASVYSDYVMGVPMFHYTSAWYVWYQPGNHDVLLSTNAVTIGGGGGTTTNSVYSNQTPLGITENPTLAGTLQVYPNPAKDMIHVKFTTDARSTVSITLTDMTGRLVTEAVSKEYAAGTESETINTSALAKGVYMLKVNAGGTSVSRKVEII